MSWWGTLEAEFNGHLEYLTADFVRQGLPTGSESGPTVIDRAPGQVQVHGRLRDVNDLEHSPQMLAWFTGVCSSWAHRGSLMWRVDAEYVSYYYVYEGHVLRRVRGVLDL